MLVHLIAWDASRTRSDGALRRLVVKLALVFGFWTLVAATSATQAYLYYSRIEDTDFWTILLRNLPVWYQWAFITLLIFWIAQRFPFRQDTWLLHVAVHLFIGLCVATGAILFVVAYNQFLGWLTEPKTFIEHFLSISARIFHYYFLFYVAIVGVAYAFEFYKKYRDRELTASRLETQLAQAQLRALKMQLHPHFLFNTLHAVSALMDEDVGAARRMLTLLSELLRLTLDNADRQEVPLHQELAFIQRYLDIQQIRFRDQLQVSIEVAPEALDACVPNLILQPLVENALQHGITPADQPSRLTIHAFQRDGLLILQVADNGEGLPRRGAFPVLRKGIGLRNTEQRLQQLYHHAYQLQYEEPPQGGLQVTLTLPFYTASEPLELVN